MAEQKRSNPHLANNNEAKFVALRNAREKMLPMPKVILHALQVNITGGRLPDPEASGTRYLEFPEFTARRSRGMSKRKAAISAKK